MIISSIKEFIIGSILATLMFGILILIINRNIQHEEDLKLKCFYQGQNSNKQSIYLCQKIRSDYD
jgi:hypothetical protein